MWFKVDDTFWGHPKAAGMCNDSLATWMRGGNWSGWQLTDGALPRAMLMACAGDAADPEAVAADLVDRRLWEPTGTGWQYHDWSDYNPTRAQVLDKRKKDAARRRDWLSRARAARSGVNHDVSSGVSHGVISPTGDDADDHHVNHDVSSAVSHTRDHASPDPTRPEGSGGVQVGEHHQDRNARDDDDAPRPNNQAGYLLDTVIIDAYRNHPQRPRTITREQATAVRARLPGYTRAEHPDAYLVKVIMNDADPGRLLAGGPAGSSTPTPPSTRTLCRRCSRTGHPTEQCPTLAPGTSPAHDGDTAAHGAKAAREALATRERPARTTPAPGPELHGEALARAQAAASRAQRLPEPPPDEPPPDDDWPDANELMAADDAEDAEPDDADIPF